jgi:hypothetical protein
VIKSVEPVGKLERVRGTSHRGRPMIKGLGLKAQGLSPPEP